MLDEWYFCSDWNHGAYAVAHLSDAIRYLVLFKYGGYYFDLDFIMTKPLGGLRRFVGAESDQYLAIAAMHHEAFHPVVQMMLEEFRDTYRFIFDWLLLLLLLLLQCLDICIGFSVEEMIGVTMDRNY